MRAAGTRDSDVLVELVDIIAATVLDAVTQSERAGLRGDRDEEAATAVAALRAIGILAGATVSDLEGARRAGAPRPAGPDEEPF